MKSTLYLKFILLYCITAFLSFFTVEILTNPLLTQQLTEKHAQLLYKQATLASNEYLKSYFAKDIALSSVRSQLNAMKLYLDSSLWFVDEHGQMIAAANLDDFKSPEFIEDFDPAEFGNAQYTVDDYHSYFKEEVITVMVPVTQGFHIRGYLIIHQPTRILLETCEDIMFLIYISVGIVFLFSFVFLLAFQYFVYHPLRQISEAATQYASGNLDYEIPIHTQDEIGYLSASLNYMSSQLKDMEDYQKKIVANVSHDFRSPLTSIKGYVEAMVDGTIPYELQDKYLNIILFETERLTDLTKDLLTLNELDTKERMLDKSEFDIQVMVKQTAASFEVICKSRRIAIELLLLPEETLVYADKRKIQQVLYNLIDNAIKFSENDSSMRIEISTQGEKVMLSIKDFGIGIPRKELNKIWERFYKSDASRGKDKKGTGLGLAIVKEIMQAHEESINVISTEGVGTEFIFSLSRVSSKNERL
jgi:signal transduction histidine kinase